MSETVSEYKGWSNKGFSEKDLVSTRSTYLGFIVSFHAAENGTAKLLKALYVRDFKSVKDCNHFNSSRTPSSLDISIMD